MSSVISDVVCSLIAEAGAWAVDLVARLPPLGVVEDPRLPPLGVDIVASAMVTLDLPERGKA